MKNICPSVLCVVGTAQEGTKVAATRIKIVQPAENAAIQFLFNRSSIVTMLPQNTSTSILRE